MRAAPPNTHGRQPSPTNAASMILSFDQNPANGGTPRMASQPTAKVAQVIFIVQQPLLTLIVLGFWAVASAGPRVWLIIGTVQLAFSGLLFVFSGIFHGVFGWHVSALQQLAGEDRADAERLAEIVHALGDTTFYIAIAATATAMIAWLPVMRRSAALPAGLARLAIVAVVFQLVEFGYFLLPGLALTAPIGIACQTAWYIWFGSSLRRFAPRGTVRPS